VPHGDLYWVEDDAKRPRPVLVVQADLFDTAPTAVALPITIKKPQAEWPFNAAIATGSAGLERPAWVRLTQPFTVPSAQLTDQIGTLPPDTLESVLAGLALLLGIPTDLSPPAVRILARKPGR
jgi:mRNA-degrading endonuclease toxin of MazEF toxin-antitoxin module